jgi:hypothetical protein
MRHWLWLALAALLLSAPWATTSPVEPRKPQPVDLGPQTAQFFRLACKGGERTCFIASGQGASPLGVYVYDPHGNCIARDEAVVSRSVDDVAVEWFPVVTTLYTIELRNQGLGPNRMQVAFR